MQVSEEVKEETCHVTTEYRHMPMIICEEPVDVSYVESYRADAVSDAVACTNVGEVRRHLNDQLRQCLMADFATKETTRRTPGVVLPLARQWRMLGHPYLSMVAVFGLEAE